MMVKEFEINDILNAVNSISKIERKRGETIETANDSTNKDDILTPVNCALSQVIYALQRANIQMGDSVVIQGAGGLGLYAVAVAKEMGASLIISVDGIQDRLDVAKEYGADYTINISEVPDSNERIELVKKYNSYRGG